MRLPELQTSRCVLHLLRPDNAHLWHAYRQKNVAYLAPWEPQREGAQAALTLEEATALKAQDSLCAWEAGTAVHLLAQSLASGAMVAACNFTQIVRGPLQAAYLGYSVDQDWQGQGLMFEVAQAGIDYMFGKWELHRIMANHLPTNTRSAALLQRLGFEREGYARSYLKIAGRWEDMVLNALVNPRS